MDILKYSLVMITSVPLLVFASPPVDLSDVEGAQDKSKQIKARTLKDSDLIYADPLANKEQKDKPGVVTIPSSVIGRTKPSVSGSKSMFKVPQGELVRILKKSKDEQWLMIEIIQTGRKTWIPQRIFDAVNSEETPK